jgi:hypothetical protein
MILIGVHLYLPSRRPIVISSAGEGWCDLVRERFDVSKHSIFRPPQKFFSFLAEVCDKFGELIFGMNHARIGSCEE